MLNTARVKPDDFKIISENCIDLGNDCFLNIIDMGNQMVKIDAHKNGSEVAGPVNAIKSPNTSIEDIMELIRDPYYLERIEIALGDS